MKNKIDEVIKSIKSSLTLNIDAVKREVLEYCEPDENGETWGQLTIAYNEEHWCLQAGNNSFHGACYNLRNSRPWIVLEMDENTHIDTLMSEIDNQAQWKPLSW